MDARLPAAAAAEEAAPPPEVDSGPAPGGRSPDDAVSRRVYVGNIPWSCSDDDLRVMFGAVGAVAHAEVRGGRRGGRFWRPLGDAARG
jgi:RNA recognition motif-containing protein